MQCNSWSWINFSYPIRVVKFVDCAIEGFENMLGKLVALCCLFNSDVVEELHRGSTEFIARDCAFHLNRRTWAHSRLPLYIAVGFSSRIKIIAGSAFCHRECFVNALSAHVRAPCKYLTACSHLTNFTQIGRIRAAINAVVAQWTAIYLFVFVRSPRNYIGQRSLLPRMEHKKRFVNVARCLI